MTLPSLDVLSVKIPVSDLEVSRAWYAKHRRHPVRTHQQARSSRGLPRWDPEVTYHLRAVPDEDIGVHVDTRAVADAVGAGLKAHSTQRQALFDPEGDDREWRRYAKREFHVVACPPQPSGTRVFADVFEGLNM